MKPKIIQLPKVADPRGNLTFVESADHLPFSIARIFWTYDVPSGMQRGGHAYYQQEEFIIALSGSFDVMVRYVNQSSEIFSLNRSNYGLYLPSRTWRHMENFSTNALALHLSSHAFDENDYLRDLSEYYQLS